MAARRVNNWTRGQTEREPPKMRDGRFDGEAIKFLGKDCRVLESA
jgi:hypothetical protein